MNSTTNKKDHDMNGIESNDYATERLKFLGCNVFQILTAEEAAVVFSFHHGQGAKLHKLLIPAVHRGSDEFVRRWLLGWKKFIELLTNVGALEKLRVSRAHFGDERRHHTVHERILRAQKMRVTHSAAHDPAQHIAAAFIGRKHAVCNKEAG